MIVWFPPRGGSDVNVGVYCNFRKPTLILTQVPGNEGTSCSQAFPLSCFRSPPFLHTVSDQKLDCGRPGNEATSKVIL